MTRIVAILVVLLSISVLAHESDPLFAFDGQTTLPVDLSSQVVSKGETAWLSPVSSPAQTAFDRLLINGMIDGGSLVFEARISRDSQWQAWQPMMVKIMAGDQFWARLDQPILLNDRIQLRVIADEKRLPNNLTFFAIEGVSLKPVEERPIPVAPQKWNYSQSDTIAKPPIISRTQWNANPPVGSYVPHDPYRLTQHHTAGARASTLQQGIERMQFIQDFHQNGRGWQDIGYHFTVDDSGRLYEGTPFQYRGTHVGGNNTGNVGISYMGNLEISGELPTPEALNSLIQLWSWLAYSQGINPDSLFGHRDYNATACPGTNLYVRLPELRNGIRRELGFGAPYVGSPFPQPFAEEVSPSTYVQCLVLDADEGVDMSSLLMIVAGDTVNPTITAVTDGYQLRYDPPTPFALSQNVSVAVKATDLASPPDTMHYEYRFRIEVAALNVEVLSASHLQNGALTLEGAWTSDNNDVNLPNLSNSQRLLAQDSDGSHIAKIFPTVSEPGDYAVLFASNSNFLGESARYRFVDEDGQQHSRVIEYNDVNFQQWALLSPTPIQLDDDGDGLGYIELSGIGEDIPTRLVLDAFRLEKIDRLDPPTAPTMKWARVNDWSNGEVQLAWYPSLEGDIAGYRLYQSIDALTWGDPLVDETVLTADQTTHTLNLTGGATYFRVVAVDTNRIVDEGGVEIPLLSEPSDAYGVGLSNENAILIVDNFDRNASWALPHHPFVANHGDALDANGLGFESCTETAVQDGDINLEDYEVVIYFCGDDSRDDESIAAADQFRLLHYLQNGGKLFISGAEIGYDFASTTATELARYQELFKANYVGDLAGSNRVIGASGTVFAGLDFNYGTQNLPNSYIEDYPDYIQAFGGSQNALRYGNSRIAGIQFTGTYNGGSASAQLVYLGFTFETIIGTDNRAALMNRAMEYFGVITAIDDDLATQPGNFRLEQNYPNPFNPTTTMEFAIRNSDWVQLTVYDLLGREVRTLVDERLEAGTHSVKWNGNDDAGNPVSSGIYFYRLTAGDSQKSRKMTLLR